MNGQQVWIVGKVKDLDAAREGAGSGWEFQGVFLTEPDAVDACVTDAYFIGPAVIGERLPHEAVDWPGSYYPRLEPKPAVTE